MPSPLSAWSASASCADGLALRSLTPACRSAVRLVAGASLAGMTLGGLNESRTSTDLGGEVRLGSMLFTMVEPHRGHEVEYNRWYERDHFYAGCMVGAWTISGGRYVATARHKAVRYPADSPIVPELAAGSYVALYWVLAGKFGE